MSTGIARAGRQAEGAGPSAAHDEQFVGTGTAVVQDEQAASTGTTAGFGALWQDVAQAA